MSEPLVVAIMLVNGRPEMVRRAVASFLAQSYEEKHLLIYDTSEDRTQPDLCDSGDVEDENITVRESNAINHHGARKSIGYLRNRAVANAGEDADIICHFDSDDVSHPQRIAEQVALLQSSGADACGYYEAPFWDTRVEILKRKAQAFVRGEGPCIDLSADPPGEAWLYRDPARKHVLGASMAYWRKTWERRPFDDTSIGEDRRFAARCNTVAVSGLYEQVWSECDLPPALGRKEGYSFRGHISNTAKCEPRIICGIHGGNTSRGYNFSRRQQCFTRAAQFDKYCRERMAL